MTLLRFGFTRGGLIFNRHGGAYISGRHLAQTVHHLLHALFDDELATAAHFFGKQSLAAVMLRAAFRTDAVPDNLYTADGAFLQRKVLGLGNQIEHGCCTFAVASRRLVMNGQAIPVATHRQ
ncbi:hypothetical protein D9M71_635590 [compost metagenome]